jgi:two-component system, OmpR family, phosphate regulon response regulator OmpR
MPKEKEKSLILAVDDDESIRMLLKQVIEDRGYRAASARDGYSALALFCQCQPDMMLLDITMPGMTGIEVLAEVRRQSDIPVIMLTGRTEALNIHQSLVAGADDYLSKPFDIDELMAHVDAKLQRRLQQHAAARRGGRVKAPAKP